MYKQKTLAEVKSIAEGMEKTPEAALARLRGIGLFSSKGGKSNYPTLEKKIEENASRKGKRSIKTMRSLNGIK
ncbi:hypothetical protein [Flammeovirga sp. SJP92]|uniref:hypothetical protein n=1 Tax=Flammeovirga sp. SJP92 TaxID=1775430 RepID=UPI00078798B3|nr:hypothetical protein [Flammeovirga sp. SJP92]KXX72761.1 hypothetical protein AVL50_32185 [Flammeovirga sp. SJP92]